MTKSWVRCSRHAARFVRRARAQSLRVARVLLTALLILIVLPQGALALTFPASPQDLTLAASVPTAAKASGVAVIDYPGGFGASTPSRLKKAGVGVVVRYVGAARWKSLTRSEANALRNSGIDIAAVYETKAGWMLGGRAAGVAAAKKARAAVIACGGPSKPFVYFACDIATKRYSTVNACLKGAASVLGADHVGIYGSYAVCANALKSGYAKKAWQTLAWSSGKVYSKAGIYQIAHRIDGSLGLDYDSNLVRADDIGQWGYTPGGVGWTSQTTSATATLNAVDFADAGTGWAVGEAGTIIRTTDGGSTWAPQTTSVTAALNSVRFVDSSTGWAVGDSGAVLHTIDGGSSWAVQSTPATGTLASVDFVDSSFGWAVGEDGTVICTTDGGTTWTAQSAPTSATLNAVRFVDRNSGCAVGASGTVMHTGNGGASWATQSAPTTATLTSVDFTSAGIGWAVGTAGVVVRTGNGGSSWAVQSAPTTATLNAVRFTDPETGWSVGASGTVLHTTNGGAAWTAQTPPTTASIISADFTDANTGWAVGDSGTVLHATGVGLSPFGTITGVVTNAVSGARMPGVSISVGSRMAAPSATDGSFVAARVAPGTYRVSFSDPRFITSSVSGVVVRATGRITLKVNLTPRAPTRLSRPSVVLAPLRSQPSTLTVTLSPASASSSAATVLSCLHYERKTVVKKVKGKKKKVKVWYWRTRFALKMRAQDAGSLLTHAGLAAGKWKVRARFPGSGKYLPSTSAWKTFTVR